MVKKRHGFEPPVLLMCVEALEEAIVNDPYFDAIDDPSKLHLGFLAAAPKCPDMDKLENFRNDGERYELIGSVFYLHAPQGVGRSRLFANAERLLGVPMIRRNWRTVCTLCAMVNW